MEEQKEKRRVSIQLIIVLIIIAAFVFMGSFASILFQGTQFESIIDNSIGKFFDLIGFFQNNYVVLLESLAILLFVFVLNYVLMLLVKLLTRKGRRGETLGVLFANIVKYITILIAAFLILAAWGVQTPTLLAGAGIAGLAVSFGAQGILEDVFAGLAIIFQKQFVVGDIVEVNDFRGTVLEIGTKNTRIKDINGNVLIIANSDIREIVNLSHELSIAISNISFEYSADVEFVERIIKENLSKIKEAIPNIVDGPVYQGVEELADSAVVVRVAAYVQEKHRPEVRRAMNRELKILFDKHGINIPFPQLVIHQSATDIKER